MTSSATLSTTIAPPALDELCINTLRFLAVDMVQKANSGHPGLPMGSASGESGENAEHKHLHRAAGRLSREDRARGCAAVGH